MMKCILATCLLFGFINSYSRQPKSSDAKNDTSKSRIVSVTKALEGRMMCVFVSNKCKVSDTVFIYGKVTDDKQSPVPYASITIPGTSYGTIADTGGNYSFQIPVNTTLLQFSSVGYAPKVMPFQLKQRSHNIDVVLTPEVAVCSEVIIQAHRNIGCKSTVICRFPSINAQEIKRDTLNMVIVLPREEMTLMNVYPNPAIKRSIVNIRLNIPGSYQLSLADNMGRSVDREDFSMNVKTALHQYQLPARLAAGIHYIVVTNKATRKQYTGKLIIQ